eukprot:8990059-Ditylum_brightwellii.AAC.1
MDYCPPFILEDTPVQVCTDLIMALSVLGAAEHVASAGNAGNHLLILSAEPTHGVHGLFIYGVADKIGGNGLVLCSTNGCFSFAMETHPSQPLMGLIEIYLWDVFLLGKKVTMQGLCNEGIIMGIVCYGGGQAEHSQSWVVSMPMRSQPPWDQ